MTRHDCHALQPNARLNARCPVRPVMALGYSRCVALLVHGGRDLPTIGVKPVTEVQT